MFGSYFSESIIARAVRENLASISIHDLRDYAQGKHRKVDDTPYGGGAGMVLKPEPIWRALEDIRGKGPDAGTRTVLFSAKGKRYSQSDAKRLAGYDRLILLCGRYEGVDERVAENMVDEELSLGDFVLTGGEVPAMAVTDSVLRLVPGVLGNEESLEFESHSRPGYLEYPQYTKPEEFNGWKVPEILLGGNHQEIAQWRDDRSAANEESHED